MVKHCALTDMWYVMPYILSASTSWVMSDPSVTRRVSFYVSLGVEVHVTPAPHQGALVVFGYTYVHVNTIHLIYTGAYV